LLAVVRVVAVLAVVVVLEVTELALALQAVAQVQNRRFH
jgi:hypothetical protein